MLSVAPKKRGRKPKNYLLNELGENITPPTPTVEKGSPKKRGRKPKPKDLSLSEKPVLKKNDNPNIIIVNKLEQNKIDSEKLKENIIVHLPISCDTFDNLVSENTTNFLNECNLDQHSTWYSSYEGKNDNFTVNTNDDFNTRLETLMEIRKNDIDITKNKGSDVRNPVDYTMNQFYECNKKKVWPEKTNIYCLNCCQPFDHKPAALPFRYQNGIFHVFGCFCYPECAAAFNFNDSICVENANENYNLLNFMYKLAYNDPFYRVKIAAHRLCLKIFGGNMDVDKYRDSFDNHYVQNNIIMPPVMSIIPLQEENNIIYYKKNVQANINNSKGHDGSYKKDKEITLKRNKPLKNKQNTLDNVMNIMVEANN